MAFNEDTKVRLPSTIRFLRPSNVTWNIKKKPLLFVVAILILAAIITWLAIPIKGGELYGPDFIKGFDMYIEEGFHYSTEPHKVWLISNEESKASIYKLCKEIKCYREISVINDIMLGGNPATEVPPIIYFNTGRYCYRIEILNWKNYAGAEWSGFPIKNELYGRPVLLVWRIALTADENKDDAFKRLLDHGVRDSMNTEPGNGWYSTMSQESLNTLLLMLNSTIGNCTNEENFHIDK